MSEEANNHKNGFRPRPLLGVGPMLPNFSPKQVSDENLAWIIDVARQAAAEWDAEPCRWIVVRSPAGKKALESASELEIPLSSAPLVLICLADALAWKSAPQHLGKLIAREKLTEQQGREILRQMQEYFASSPQVAQRAAQASGLLAMQQVLLGAASSGLSTCLVMEFNQARIKKYFHIPEHFVVAALLPIGYREETPATAPFEVAQRNFVYEEKFGEAANLTS